MFITPVPESDADGVIGEIYATEKERWGFLPEFVTSFSHHPEAYQAWLGLATALYSGMDRRRCELATLAATRVLGSTSCAVAHGKMLRDNFYASDEVLKIAKNHRDAGLDEVDVAIMDFAEKVASEPSTVTDDDVAVLRAHGLSDREIFDVALAVAVRAFFATLIESLGVRAERPLARSLDPELLKALTYGRPAMSEG